MRVVFVCPPLTLAGGNKVIFALAARLRRRGLAVSLVAPGGPPHPALRPDPEVPVRLVPLSGRSAIGTGLRLGLAVPAADAVVATHTSTLWSGLLAARRFGAPLVWLYQDYPEMFRGRPVLALTHRLGPYLADRIAAGSRAGAGWLLGQFSEKTRVVGQALYHTEHLWAVPRPRPGARSVRILALADERPRKGFTDLLAALRRLRPRPVLWTVTARPRAAGLAGPGPDCLFFSPDDAGLGNLYRACDVFVFPSRAEGFGLPPLEAMACGTPVVLADSRGVREYAVDGVNCLMVPPGDPAALAAAIERVGSDPELAARLSRAGPETAARFAPEPVVERFIGVLTAAISAHKLQKPA